MEASHKVDQKDTFMSSREEKIRKLEGQVWNLNIWIKRAPLRENRGKKEKDEEIN